MPSHNADSGGYPKQAVGAAITKTVTEFMVKNWLGGSKLKADRPTLAELESCGYRVIKASPNDRSGTIVSDGTQSAHNGTYRHREIDRAVVLNVAAELARKAWSVDEELAEWMQWQSRRLVKALDG